MTPRLLAIMGSGETTPTMVKTHRELLARLGPPPVPAALLDTPFGFQANADDLAARAVEYFRRSVGHDLALASFRHPAADPLEHETMLARLREARYVFSGPGSPSYALRLWRGTQVPKILAEKLQSGGCLTFASAAALTLGVATVPVYEIYKVGEEPHWLEGLDLLSEAGLSAAVVPHYDNAEGGTHDTRFSWLGEERLVRMEQLLPDGAFILGVDEHTGLLLDLDAGIATVVGLGGVTVRSGGRSTRLPAGETLPTAELAALAGRAAASPAGLPGAAGAGGGLATTGDTPGPSVAVSPLLAAVGRHASGFDASLEGGDVPAGVRAVLDLEEELAAWAADLTQSDELDRARAALRAMVVRLGELVAPGPVDPAAIGPFVDLLLELRAAARAAERWAEADAVRDGLVVLGVEVRDGPEGTTWGLLS